MSLSTLVSWVVGCVDLSSQGNTTVEMPCSSTRLPTSLQKSVGFPTEMWLFTLIISSPRKPCRMPARLSLFRVSPDRAPRPRDEEGEGAGRVYAGGRFYHPGQERQEQLSQRAAELLLQYCRRRPRSGAVLPDTTVLDRCPRDPTTVQQAVRIQHVEQTLPTVRYMRRGNPSWLSRC